MEKHIHWRHGHLWRPQVLVRRSRRRRHSGCCVGKKHDVIPGPGRPQQPGCDVHEQQETKVCLFDRWKSLTKFCRFLITQRVSNRSTCKKKLFKECQIPQCNDKCPKVSLYGVKYSHSGFHSYIYNTRDDVCKAFCNIWFRTVDVLGCES